MRRPTPQAATKQKRRIANSDKEESPNSAAQPVPKRHEKLRPHTPRVNGIFLTDDDSAAPLQDLLENIAKEYLFGKVANIVATARGCYEAATAPDVIEKLEALLEIIQEQRARHLRRHPHLATDRVFDGDHMHEIHKEWMHDDRTWMNADTVREYEWWLSGTWRGDQQKAHQIRRRAFSAFLFQVIGNKHVLLACIQHPICSAAQPATSIGSAAQPAAITQRFMTAWEQEKSSDDYKKRVQVSQRSTDERRALKKAAHAARQALARAKKINGAILRGSRAWEDLSNTEKALLDDFNSGSLIRIRDECDAAFGWNKQMRGDAGSAAARVGR